jgi:hypothetical protein
VRFLAGWNCGYCQQWRPVVIGGNVIVCDDCLGLYVVALAAVAGETIVPVAASRYDTRWLGELVRLMRPPPPKGRCDSCYNHEATALVPGPRTLCETCIERGVSVFVSAQ